MKHKGVQRVIDLALEVLDRAAYRSRTDKVDTLEVRLALAVLWVILTDMGPANGLAAAHTPEARAKMAATKRGKPASEATRAALLAAAKRPKPEGWGKRASAWMRAAKERPTKK